MPVLVTTCLAALCAQAVVLSGPADAQATSRAAASNLTCNGAGLFGALGVYAGAGNAAGVRRFESGTGAHVAIASDFLPRNQGWAGMTTNLGWLLGAWRGSGCTLVLAVPMIPTNSRGTAQGSLAAGAAGAYNGEFATLARSLVASGEAHVALRLGWEFNGNWYPWQVRNATDARNFVAYWRNVVTAMRSVPGQQFRFVWNPNDQSSFGSAYAPGQVYPGNAYVDQIGDDVYDQCWCSPKTPTNSWFYAYYQAWGLHWLQTFAADNGKVMSIPEWGETIRSDGHGLGDDPTYIADMASFVASNHVFWTSYFNFDASDGQHDIFDPAFSAALAEFKAVHMGNRLR